MITADDVFVTVADHYGITIDEILMPSRLKDIAHPRHVAIYICCDHYKMRAQRVAEAIGFDHSSIVHARKNVRHLVGLYREDREKLNEILTHLQS